MYLLPLLPLLALTSAAPAGRKNCRAKTSSGTDAPPIAVGALVMNVQESTGNQVMIPTGTGNVTPYVDLPQTQVAGSNTGVVAAWDRGGWSGWGKPKSTSAAATAAPATAAPPASQPPVPPASQPAAPPPPTAPPASQAVPPASQQVAPPASTTPATLPPASGGGGQAGLGLDDTSWSKLTNTPGLDWYWNWKYQPFAGMQAEYVACIWGEVMANEFIAGGSLPAGTQYVMSFNEPDMGADVGGSNISDVAAASTLHQQWTAKLPQGVKVGAPAVARGGDVKWFTPWVTACAGNCKYDFVPIHFYGVVVEDLFTYIKSFPTGGKPIWVTEFDCQDFTTGEICEPAKQTDFMDRAIAWFKGEGSAYVERWAWFGAFPKDAGKAFGVLDAQGGLSEFGQHYLSL
ncbi:hypothetical protein I302_108291 [Kwoniella bestiolae CBS 10118]|uniref:Asl1-like glycosyl hydrolase catalytic domain-containing protein n=1 Tax=Kwoniella bestiolae CBS 10118 TaxID=1296100 RepID=A0AAJ8MD22_9TREE